MDNFAACPEFRSFRLGNETILSLRIIIHIEKIYACPGKMCASGFTRTKLRTIRALEGHISAISYVEFHCKDEPITKGGRGGRKQATQKQEIKRIAPHMEILVN